MQVCVLECVCVCVIAKVGSSRPRKSCPVSSRTQRTRPRAELPDERRARELQSVAHKHRRSKMLKLSNNI